MLRQRIASIEPAESVGQFLPHAEQWLSRVNVLAIWLCLLQARIGEEQCVAATEHAPGRIDAPVPNDSRDVSWHLVSCNPYTSLDSRHPSRDVGKTQ
jgi:hypothetical protein